VLDLADAEAVTFGERFEVDAVLVAQLLPASDPALAGALGKSLRLAKPAAKGPYRGLKSPRPRALTKIVRS
jgi:hypothetical protein